MYKIYTTFKTIPFLLLFFIISYKVESRIVDTIEALQEKKIGEMKNIVLFCALGFRSALATKALKEMGFKNVANASGGFDALKNAGLEVVNKEKK